MLAFLETVDPEADQQVLPVYDEKTHVLLFFKYYNPKTRIMAYCGHMYVPLTEVPSKTSTCLFTETFLSHKTSM